MRQVSFFAHEDRASGDWVVSVSYGDNRVAVAACNGESEASLIARSLNEICNDASSSSELIRDLWQEYMTFSDDR